MIRSILASAIVAAFSICAIPAHAQNYDVRITGVDNGLRATLELVSDLKKNLRDYPTIASLRRAALRDQKALDEALTAAGYYLGEVSFEIERGDGDAAPVVTFIIEPGPAFVVTEYEILYRDDEPDRPATLKDAKIKPDRSAAGAAIRDVQLKFLDHLWNSGYPGAEIAGRRAIALPEKAEASAVLVFRSGPRARFGEIDVRGVNDTKPDFVRDLATWAPGAEYDRGKIVSYRDRLANTGLFSTISVAPGTPGEDGAAPVLVDLAERRRRTIGAGLSYSTAEGPGGRLFFEHRNLAGRGEDLRIDLRGNEFEQSIDFAARKPFPELPGFVFATLGFSNETTEAFDARSLRLAGGVAKDWLDDRLETRAALALETSNVKTNGVEQRTYFVSAPLSVIWDSEDDLLEPTKGLRASVTMTPYTGTDTFAQVETAARSRLFIGTNDVVTLAGRVGAGATFANSLFDLPANKRFFAGGGGSVRGFGFQEAGPLDADNDPIGGRSYFFAGTELRGMITDNIQLAGFVDAGTVTATPLPSFNDRFFVGYGAGARYFTPIGPIRFDIAFPLDARPSDANFQIYISIGQPF
ncbi:MAG: BamA/TamA family outer membrane protein [Pseudomonadota bacterium]